MVMLFLYLLSQTASDILIPYEVGDPINIDLDPWGLPYYAFRTILRMFVALAVSLFVAFIFGSMAAKSATAERIILPAVDVLQSIPVIGFLELAFIWFLYAFPGSFLGPEIASIFAVFVSQVWNLILAFYQSLKTIPVNYQEMAFIYRFSPWQKFCKLELPFAAPSLIWNSMLSLSAGWFFVVAGEAITIANHDVALPGIGAYIAQATKEGNVAAIYYAIACLFVVILIYDQMIFRPLNYWLRARKGEGGKPNWVWKMAKHSVLLSVIQLGFTRVWLWISARKKKHSSRFNIRVFRVRDWHAYLGYMLTASVSALLVYYAVFSLPDITLDMLTEVFVLGFYTAMRVMLLVILCALIWTPVGIYLGLNERVADILQPVVQFLASFPPNMLYPLIGSVIIYRGYNPDIWLSPLIVLGTQWYVLFNVIAGVRAMPEDALMLSDALQMSRWLMFKRVLMPGILPSMVTGMLTAAGGAWNTSIVAEAVDWNGQRIYAQGLGAYIMQASQEGLSQNVYLGVLVMCVYVLVINRFVWMPLYRFVAQRYGGNL